MAPQKHRHITTDTKLSDAGFTADELAVLSITRRYGMSYLNSTFPFWEDAIDIAVSRFGEDRGPVIAVAVLNVLRRMRIARKTTFDFQNPYCHACSARLTRCERLLMRTVRFVESGEQAGATVEAMILCEGNDTGPTLEAMSRLIALKPF